MIQFKERKQNRGEVNVIVEKKNEFRKYKMCFDDFYFLMLICLYYAASSKIIH